MCKDSMDLERYKNLNHDEHIVPEGVSIIYSDAFHGCSDLRKIEIPEEVTTIEDFAFYGCHNLHVIVIPESLTNIDYYFCGINWPYGLNFVLPNGKRVDGYDYLEERDKNKAQKEQKGEKKEEPSKENDSGER